MSGVQPLNSSAIANDLRIIFENLSYGPAPEADNVAQVYVTFSCHFRSTRVARTPVRMAHPILSHTDFKLWPFGP